MHNFVPPPPEEWGDFCWSWVEDEKARCGWPEEEHQHRSEVNNA